MKSTAGHLGAATRPPIFDWHPAPRRPSEGHTGEFDHFGIPPLQCISKAYTSHNRSLKSDALMLEQERRWEKGNLSGGCFHSPKKKNLSHLIARPRISRAYGAHPH